MNVLIIGATGATGKILLDQALAAGHEVTMLTRDTTKFTSQVPHLRVVQGDVLQPSSVESTVQGQDAVLSLLGPNKKAVGTVASEGTRNIIAAMQAAGVRRFICSTLFGIGSSETFFRHLISNLFLKDVAQDRLRQETIVRESNLDWTIIRPTRLVDTEKPGKRQVLPEGKAGFIGSTSRTDLASFMLEQLTTDAYLHQAPAVGY